MLSGHVALPTEIVCVEGPPAGTHLRRGGILRVADAEVAMQARSKVELIEAGFWRAYVHIGVITYGLGGLAALGYALATPHGPHRGALLILDGGSVAASVGLFWWLGLRLVPTRWRTPFFGIWTMSTFAFVASAAVLDGGIQSPLSYFLVLPLLFAGLAYPPRTVSTLSGVGVVVAAVVGLAGSRTDAAATILLATAMVVAGILATSMARNRNRLTTALVDAATHDGLTRCLTRRAFYERLHHEAARSQRYGRRFGVIVADLDELKVLNDRGGHEAGDEALRVLADALVGAARGTDLVGRLGGDEFALLLPEAGSEDTQVAAERLLERIRAAETAVAVTASLGGASWSGPADDPDALMQRADRALYAAKRAGRDRFRFSVSPPPAGAHAAPA